MMRYPCSPDSRLICTDWSARTLGLWSNNSPGRLLQDQGTMIQKTPTSSGVLAPKTAHTEMTALLDVYARNFRTMNNYSIHTSKQAVVYFRASETPERFSKLWTKWSGGGIQFHSVPGRCSIHQIGWFAISILKAPRTGSTEARTLNGYLSCASTRSRASWSDSEFMPCPQRE
jgi:hypothetical protein